MQVHHSEGVAIRTGPEPCVGIREGAGEAWAGEHMGQPWGRESKKVLRADAVRITEYNNGYVADGLPGGEFDTSTGYPMSKLLALQNSRLMLVCRASGRTWMPTRISAYHADMRFSAIRVANAVAWAVLIGLIAVAFVLVEVWGPFGLVVLGLAALLVCTSLSLHDDTPTWGTEIFRARMTSHGSPEQRAAMLDEKRSRLPPLSFYRWCGVVLIVAGMSGFIWQQLR